MIDLSYSQVLDAVRATHSAYYKLTILAGPSGVGKTRLLNHIATGLQIPTINLSLLLSQRLLSQTRRQRALKAEEFATQVIDEHFQTGLCLDNTELLFDATLKTNPLIFLQDISRNRFIVATWNGGITGSELRYANAGHPDYFSQASSGYPVISVSEDKFQLYLTT
jgi:hypothetical protein